MMRKLRVRRGVLQTPVIRYGHRATGSTVTLVGTAHIGEASYYNRLHATVTQLEAAGAVVCYEWVLPAAAEDWAAASASERAARDAPPMGKGSIRRVCRSLGWVEQGAVFTWAASWRNVDMTDLELVKAVRPEAMRQVGEHLADVFGSPSLAQDQADALAGAVAAVVFRLVSLDWFDRLEEMATWDDASRRFSRVKIEERNARALESLPSGTDAVLLWGAGHLPGLAAGLTGRGYWRQGTTWVAVGRLPALWPSIRTVCRDFLARR